ncbi:hypothetical protein PX554_18675 [Sphingomonas sp. H39-1-10]|uniref:hypothetical protein n=1 Tax=Sphingomonas pollutisoli TaxID=3030829 RepID=UPI0023B9832D|nr:hypothetical protein [Sphingomonas pollutisoli]MDF0490155.1 hypothetical protein [Sphingomonas pollutisoli]
MSVESHHTDARDISADKAAGDADLERRIGRLVERVEELMGRVFLAPDVSNDNLIGVAPSDEQQEDIALANAKYALAVRRMRDKVLGGELFFDPAWNILIELYVAYGDGMPVTVGNACIAAAVPLTSALRCCQLLQQKRIVVRERDPRDGRRVFLRLSEESYKVLTKIFVGGPARK